MIYIIIWIAGWIILSIFDGAYEISHTANEDQKISYSLIKLFWPVVIVGMICSLICFAFIYLLNYVIELPTLISKKYFDRQRKNKIT
jgi:uncharacterized protein (DUF2062 family)